MTIIEGIGDEVIYFIGFALLVIILTLAWTSTSVSEHALIRTAVFVIDRRRRRSLNNNNNNNTTSSVVGVTNNNTEARNRTTNFINLRSVDHVSTPRIQSAPVSNETLTRATVPTFIVAGETVSAESSQFSDINLIPSSTQVCGSAPVDVSSLSASTSGNKHTHSTEPTNLRHRNTSNPDRKTTGVDCNAEPLIDSDNASPKVATAAADPAYEFGPSAAEPSIERTSSSEEFPPTEGSIRVRLKFLNDSQKLVEARLMDQLGQFKRRHFGEELGNNKIVRLIFNGQLLQRDHETLQFYGLFDNCVVHCHISSSISSPSDQAFPARVELDLSRLMLPLFGLILGLIWCCRIQYRQYFSGTSTFALLCITGLFVMSVVALWLPARAGHVRG